MMSSHFFRVGIQEEDNGVFFGQFLAWAEDEKEAREIAIKKASIEWHIPQSTLSIYSIEITDVEPWMI